MSKRTAARRWIALGLTLTGLVIVVMAAHRVSASLPGPAGAIFRHNVQQRIDASALLYTESGDVRDYLDAERGKYR